MKTNILKTVTVILGASVALSGCIKETHPVHALCRLFRNLYLTLRRESHRQLLILFFYYIIFSIFLNYGSKRNFGSF